MKSQGVNQAYDFMRPLTPVHKRRKLDSECLPTNEAKLAFLNQNLTVKAGENAQFVHNSHSVQVSKQNPHLVEVCETVSRDMSELSPPMKGSHEAEKSPYRTKRVLDFALDADTISVFQAGLNNFNTDRLRSTPDVNMRLSMVQGDSSSLQLGESVSDEEVSMDLDSITESARSPSPVFGKRSSQAESPLCADPAVTSTQHGALKIQRDDARSLGTEVGSLVDERTEKGDNSPPYSPRLESEFTNTPAAGNPLFMQLRAESGVSSAVKHTQSVNQNPPLMPVQLPLTVTPSGPAVSPETPLQAILAFPTTTFPCANCSAQFPIFVPVVRADGKNLW